MPQSADETAEKGNDLKEESDVIDLTEEVPPVDSSPEAEESSSDEETDTVTREVRVPDDDASEPTEQTLDEQSDEEIIELRETVQTEPASEVDPSVPSAAIFKRRDGSPNGRDAVDADPQPEDAQGPQGESDAELEDDEPIELDDPIDDEAVEDEAIDDEPIDLEEPIDEAPPDEAPSDDPLEDDEPIDLDEPVEEEIGYDRQAMVKTIQMSAIDRREFERQVQAEEIGESVVLTDHSHAPDVLVVPPRVLTTRWKEGGPLLRAGIVDAPSPEAVEEVEAQRVDEPASVSDTLDAPDLDEPVAKEPADSQPSESEPVESEPVESEPAESEPAESEPAESEPAESEPAAQEVDDEDLPEIEPEAVELELDSEAIEDAQVKPPPKPSSPPPAKAKPAKPEDEELSGLVQELLDENKKKPKKKARKPRSPRDTWFKNVFTEEYLRTLPRGIHRQTKREVDFIEKSFELGEDDRVLDLACGFGRHSIELTKRGYEVAGLDLSMPLLQKALNEAKKQSLSIKFIHGDMRELSFDAIFNACFLWQTSFGFFDDQTNFRVLRGIHRSLRPGGKLLIDVLNRDHIAPKMPHRLWWEGVDCVFLEEVDLDHRSSVLHTKRSFIYEDGSPPLEQNTFLRLYSLHEIAQLLKAAGFAVREVSGELHHRGHFLGPASSRIVVLAEKRPPKNKGSRS